MERGWCDRSYPFFCLSSGLFSRNLGSVASAFVRCSQFIDIYIQGSKYNFLELSLKNDCSLGWRVYALSVVGMRVSVITICLPRGGLQIDQATKSA